MSYLRGVGKVIEKELKQQGLVQVRDFFALEADDMEDIAAASACKTLTVAKLRKLRGIAVAMAQPGACLHVPTDHTTAPNPYAARYGQDRWEGEIRKSATLQKYVCVKELVWHINAESVQALQGTR